MTPLDDVGMLVLRADLSIVLANRFFHEAFQVGDDVVGRVVTDVISVKGLRELALEVVATGEPRYDLQLESLEKDGGLRPLRVTIVPVRLGTGFGDGLALVVRDLGMEERLRSQSRASDAHFREVVENATDGIVMVGDQDAICYFNRAAERMFGYARNEVLGRPVSMLMPADYGGRGGFVLAHLAPQPSTDGDNRQIDWLHRNGTKVPIDCTISVCRMDGEIVLAAMLRDVTDRVRAEQALKRSEQGFRTLIEQTPDAIAVHRRGRFVYVNPSMVRLLGYASHAELVERPVSVIVHPDDRDLVTERIRAMMATGQLAAPREERFVRRDGTIVYAEVVAMPLVYEGEPAIVAIGRDLTERKQLTARVMQMDRMLAVGTLAAGVGHEINNPLSYVAGNVAFATESVHELRTSVETLTTELRRRFGADTAAEVLSCSGTSGLLAQLEEIEEVLGDAREGSDRIRDIVRDLRTFSRGDADVSELLEVHGVIESAINMAFSEIRHRARLVKDFGDPPPVCGNGGRLGQVVLNLLVNAAHAIEAGAAGHNEIRVRTYRDGTVVIIEVRDTGHGIKAEDLPRLFDPFFTTKPIGQGTGLGLSICRQIVDAHAGRIEVESTPGKGSVFRVILPAAEEPIPESSPRTDPGPSARRGHILIVDDELKILQLMERILGNEHHVATETAARTALRRLKAREAFDIIFCDLMMPDMTGMDLFEETRQFAPELADRFVFITGGAFTPHAREFLDRVSNPRIDKPIEPKSIRELVRDLLR